MKRVLSIVLTVCILLIALSGCGSTELRSYSEEAQNNQSTEARDMSAAYKAYSPDTVVMKIGNAEITWQEYFYWLNSCISALDADNGSVIEDLSAQCPYGTEGESYADYTFRRVEETLIQYHAMSNKAEELNISLTDDNKATLEASLKSDIANICGSDGTEEDFDKYLESIYMTRDYYTYVNSVALFYSAAFNVVFGENGELCSDEDAMSYAEENGYMAADHILISTVDENGATFTGDDLANAEAQAKEISSQLKAISGKDALFAKFKELKNEYSQDTGMSIYPDGYCFKPGDMVSEFENAVKSQEEYEVSDPVQSDYGYHIIITLPVTPDTNVEYVSEGKYKTIRYLAAIEQYNAVVNGWIESESAEWMPEFENFDIISLLSK